MFTSVRDRVVIGRGHGRGFSAILLVLLLMLLELSPLFVLQYHHSVAYAEVVETEKQLTRAFLEHVVGFNLTNYEIVSCDTSGLLPEYNHVSHEIRMVIRNDSTFNVSVIFRDGKFRLFLLTTSVDQLTGNKTFNDYLLVARRTTQAYRCLFNAPYCAGLEDMISEAMQDQSLTVDNNDALLKTTRVENCSTPLDYRDYIELKWYKKIEHQLTIQEQTVSMHISKSGILTSFMDNLAHFHVASTSVNITEEQAINIAMPYAEAEAQQHGCEITLTDATLGYNRDTEASRGDCSAIYPLWSVRVFYKPNGGLVSGYSVLIWADNAQVFFESPMGIYTTPNDGDIPFVWFVFVTIVIVLALLSAVLGTYLKRKKRSGDVKDEHLP